MSEFATDDKVTSATFMALIQAEGIATDWEDKKAINIIKRISKALSVLLTIGSWPWHALRQNIAARTEISQHEVGLDVVFNDNESRDIGDR